MPTVLCFGDSNTFGYTAQGGRFYPAETWPQQYRKLLKHPVTFHVNGVCGRYLVAPEPTSASTLDGARTLRHLISHRPPDALILQLGTNDLLAREFGNAALGTYLADLLRDLLQQNPKMNILTLLPSLYSGQAETPWPGTTFADVADRLKGLQTAFQNATEAYGQFCLSTEKIEKDPLDGIHFTLRGHHALAQMIRHTFPLSG